LRPGEGDAGDRGIITTNEVLGERSPSAPDLENALAALEAEMAGHPFELVALRSFQRKLIVVDGGGIVHALIEPVAIELVPEVVMGRDVLPAAGPGVFVGAVPDPIEEAGRARAADAGKDRLVSNEEVQHADEVVGRPITGNIAIGEAGLAGDPDTPQRPPAMHRDGQFAAEIASPEIEMPAIGQRDPQVARLNLGEQPFNHPGCEPRGPGDDVEGYQGGNRPQDCIPRPLTILTAPCAGRRG
jgi:hypothetical protein